MTTPGGWHDEARKRDAGHDEMQLAVYRFLLTQRRPYTTDEVGASVFSTVFEFPIGPVGSRVVRDRIATERTSYGDEDRPAKISAFADIAELYGPPGRGCWDYAVLYEVKPKIETIGGIVRQCRALRQAFEASFPKAQCAVIVVIPRDDPLLKSLMEIQSCYAWDAAEQRLLRPRPSLVEAT